MKFKVYVCTDKEEHEGLCDPCTTEACYYKGKILYSIFWIINKFVQNVKS